MSPDPTPENHPLPTPVERVRESRPDGEAWRADALGSSRHSRWVNELRQPLNLEDNERAEVICGQVTRMVLQDFAPALMLLSALDRRRLQAMTAYALTLLDFARQSGMEGERLTAINRWEFDLEVALDAQPAGQPVFVAISRLEQQRPWSRRGFDQLHAYARHRCVVSRPKDRPTAERGSLLLGRSMAWLLLGDEPAETVSLFASTLARLRGLMDLGDDLRRHRARLPVSEIPDASSPDPTTDSQFLGTAIEDECRRLDSALSQREFLTRLPRDLQPAARYSQRAGRSLLAQIRSAGTGIIDAPPRVGLTARLAMLVCSRWF